RNVFPPMTRFIALVYGMITISSWSTPWVLKPFGVSTPAITNGTFLISQGLTYHIIIAVNLRCRRLADNANFVRASYIRICERRATGHRSFANIEVIAPHAADPG